MYEILVTSILAVGAVFLALTLVIVGNKAWRESRDAWRRSRRRVLEPLVLAYAHGDEVSILTALGGQVAWQDRRVVEPILLAHVERVRGIEGERLSRALDEVGYVDEYLKGLTSRRWWRRAESAEKLGVAGAHRAIDFLIRGLEDEVYEVRLRAAKSLGALGGVAAVRPLIAALSEPSRWSTIRIADILTAMGQEVVDELITAFPDLSHHAKLAALDILGSLRSPHAAVWLRLRLKDFETDVRARACHALGAIGDRLSGHRLIESLRDPEWPVRAMAAKALGRIRHIEAIRALCTSLRDREWWVRANAAAALRLMNSKGIESLRIMLDDQDVYARHQAVLMLEEAGVLDEEVGQLLADDPDKRYSARVLVDRLVQIGQLSRLRELAGSHPDPRVREVLADLLPEEREQEEATT